MSLRLLKTNIQKVWEINTEREGNFHFMSVAFLSHERLFKDILFIFDSYDETYFPLMKSVCNENSFSYIPLHSIRKSIAIQKMQHSMPDLKQSQVKSCHCFYHLKAKTLTLSLYWLKTMEWNRGWCTIYQVFFWCRV